MIIMMAEITTGAITLLPHQALPQAEAIPAGKVFQGLQEINHQQTGKRITNEETLYNDMGIIRQCRT